MEWDAEEARLQRERLEKDMRTIRGQVFHILNEFPETRENDGILICYWLQQFRGVGSFQGLLRLCIDNEFSFETVRRSRQKIQSWGLLLPSDEVVIKRRKLEKVWREVQKGR